MANPSLQIGNTKWAIKKDNELGYSTSGTRFFPIPITMNRASAGTRVNSAGLVETVELLGSELITNGDFSTDASWTKGTGWTISGGSANCDGTQSGNTDLSQNITTDTGKQYKITYTVSNYSAGSIFIRLNSGNVTSTKSSNGTFTEILSGAGGTQVILRANLDFIGSVDNVSVKEITRNDLARVDYTGSVSSLLVEPQRTNLVTYSEDFSDSSWTKLGAGTGSTAVITSNYAISPDGTQNATRLVCDLNGGTTTSDQSLIHDLDSSNTSQSISIYIKSNTGSNQNIYFANTFGTGDTSIVTSDWQRFEFNHSTSNHTFSLGLRGNTGADDTADILIWGAQSESGSYATSYIPTSGLTVTRVKDQFTKTGISNKINSEEGVLFVEMAALANDSTNRMLSLYASGNDKLTLFYKTASNSMTVQGFVGGGLQINRTIVLTDITKFSKIAIRYKINDFAWFVDGNKITDDTSTNTWSANTLNKLSFDDGSSGNPLFAKVKQLQVFKTALSDDELTILTGTSGVDFYPSYADMASALTYKIQ